MNKAFIRKAEFVADRYPKADEKFLLDKLKTLVDKRVNK